MRAAVPAFAALTLTPLTAPATAADALVLVCSIQYPAYVDLVTDVTGTCVATGTRRGVVSLRFSTLMPAGLCPALSTAAGTMSGAGLSLSFTWSRYGTAAMIAIGPSPTGVLGVGHGEFVPDQPERVCGTGPATETAVLTFALP